MKITFSKKKNRFSGEFGVVYPPLNREILKKEFDIVDSYDEADYILATDSLLDIDEKHHSKVILFQKESPLTSHRIWTYRNFDKFKYVFCHNPNGDNQFNYAENQLFFPFTPLPKNFTIREDTTLKSKNIFYAGKKSDSYAKLPDRFNTSTLYDTRDYLVQDSVNYPQMKCYGVGWENAIEGKSTRALYKTGGGWRSLKLQDMNDCNAEFNLVLENCIQENLITDHLWDGLASDRVMLYLGEPNIEKFMPINCFIDLRPYFDKETKRLDLKRITEKVNSMTQEEYNNILNNAREFRKKAIDKWEEARDKLTYCLNNKLKKKISLPYGAMLDKEILKKEFIIVDDPKEADNVICWKYYPKDIDLKKCILFQNEPPKKNWDYSVFDKFKYVFTFNPKEDNEVMITTNPLVYPYNPAEKIYKEFDISIGNRGAHFAGKITDVFLNYPDCYGSLNIYPIRKIIGEYFKKKSNFTIYGEGLGGRKGSKAGELWREEKWAEIINKKIPFVFCLENSIMKNYITEKLHDAFITDKVPLYLGEPNIEQYVPSNCFIDLRKYFNIKDKTFNCEQLEKDLNNMPEEEYKQIILNIREFKKTLIGEHKKEKIKTTKHLIKLIK